MCEADKLLLFHWSLAGFWTFLYFVSFCFLANQWSRTTADELPLNAGADAARAAIAFSFFSIITWVRTCNDTDTSTVAYSTEAHIQYTHAAMQTNATNVHVVTQSQGSVYSFVDSESFHVKNVERCSRHLVGLDAPYWTNVSPIVLKVFPSGM